MTRFNLFRRATLVAALACAGSMAFAQAPMKLTLGHNAAPGNPKALGAIYFAEQMNKRSNGRITVQVAGGAHCTGSAATVSMPEMVHGSISTLHQKRSECAHEQSAKEPWSCQQSWTNKNLRW